MFSFKRSDENPILVPQSENIWEAEAVFNGCPIFDKNKFHFLYRAVSSGQMVEGKELKISSIGHALSDDGIHFKNRKQFIKPEYDWEKFGCEDPRVTKLGNKFYIFYTALSQYPFTAEGIRIGLAITRDFRKIDAKYPVTTFNSKAMALFPEKIGGKITAVLTVNTDKPPARIAIAQFDREEQIWSREYWEEWYLLLNYHIVSLQRGPTDHIEVGAPPLKTKYGWLLIYSYISNYFSPPATFGVKAALLNLKNPLKIVAATDDALMYSREEYEKYGNVPNVVFPSGALVLRGKLNLYYGAADTTCALASGELDELIEEIRSKQSRIICLERFAGNPIIKPKQDSNWQAKATFNPGVVYAGGKIHLLYRAMDSNNTSTIGYAVSSDGYTIDDRLPQPVYVPRADFEKKLVPGANSGCEDPRLTVIGNTVYMCYTAFDGKNPTRVAFTSIPLEDFLNRRWNWKYPVLISPPGTDDKDAALFPKKINGKYVFLHRVGNNIWIDFVDSLQFDGNRWLQGKILMTPRRGKQDSRKIGITGPPIETKYGWLLIYHGISKEENKNYRLKAALLNKKDPTRIIARTDNPILEAREDYEKTGNVNNVVFSCGSVVMNNTLFVYYGGADKVVGVATIKFSEFMKKLLREKNV
jgi:predicted GH43/DUF377 family glycosyl hydrolase